MRLRVKVSLPFAVLVAMTVALPVMAQTGPAVTQAASSPTPLAGQPNNFPAGDSSINRQANTPPAALVPPAPKVTKRRAN